MTNEYAEYNRKKKNIKKFVINKRIQIEKIESVIHDLNDSDKIVITRKKRLDKYFDELKNKASDNSESFWNSCISELNMPEMEYQSIQNRKPLIMD